jgi:hypothetical protein
MKSKSVLAVGAAIAVGVALLLPSVASAQSTSTEEHNAYFAVKFGPYFPSETNGLNAVGNTFEKWPTKYELDGALGAYWGIFGLQLNVGYLTTGTSDVDFKTFPILAIARIRLPIGGFIAPYGEGGAGVGISSVKGLGADSTKAGFAAIAGAGVDIYIGQLLLGAELKYLWLDPGFSATQAGSSQAAIEAFKFNGITVQGYVGFRF